MLETWRWFDQNDPITLLKVAQAGAKGVVSSLNEIATGEEWPMENLLQRKKLIEDAGLEWSVIESIPVHNDIKTRSGDFERHVENYKKSIINASKAGISVVCYNFMPVIDWTRTNLDYKLKNVGSALRFDMIDFIAYDVFVLKRNKAVYDYNSKLVNDAEILFRNMSQQQISQLEQNIIAGLPGGEGSYTRESILEALEQFIALGEDGLRKNLFSFLEEIIPVASQVGVQMCIHPDDPPFSLFGLPRVLSTADDVRKLFNAIPDKANGLTLCSGSFGAREDNNLTEMAKEFGPRIYFAHLRNVKREENGSFYEAEHLKGDTDMVSLINALLSEEQRRKNSGEKNSQIPMRPDHGHLLVDEENSPNLKPGYSYQGRMKGLAELRGVIHALTHVRNREAALWRAD